MHTSEEKDKYTPHLYHWYIKKAIHPYTGEECARAHGIVTGHRSLTDTTPIHTSRVLKIDVNKKAEQVCIHTMHTEYHCKFSDCDFSQPDTYEMIPTLSEYAEKYKIERIYEPPENSVLLVLSDHERYYFKTIVIKKNGVIHKGEMLPHIGTFQDSCLVSCMEYDKPIDIRYFAHYQHLEAYFQETDGLPVYLENEGDRVIFYKTQDGVIKLNPHEQKLVSKENVMKDNEIPALDQGDLYPPKMQ